MKRSVRRGQISLVTSDRPIAPLASEPPLVSEPQRDQPLSSFGEILAQFAAKFPQVEVVVFYDEEGETVDYFSLWDPFRTRLVAAHHGVIYESMRSRLLWMAESETQKLAYYTDFMDCATYPVGEIYRVTILAPSGTIDTQIQAGIDELVEVLREEAGL